LQTAKRNSKSKGEKQFKWQTAKFKWFEMPTGASLLPFAICTLPFAFAI